MSADPQDLVDLDPDRPDVEGSALVVVLDGFVDAGAATRLARETLLAGDTTVVARFDVDRLHDYRARRPMMRFDSDHWSDYDAPELAVHLAHGTDDVPFLVLSGPEPDVQWERFTRAVQSLVATLGVRLTIGLGAFPMSVPHTRPTSIIVHGSRRELFADHRPWLGQIAVPASAAHLIEYRLGSAGMDALGVAAPVPPYLAQTEYPTAALALLHELTARAGVAVDLSPLEAVERENRAAIEREVASSDEMQALVTALEKQYDTQAALNSETLPSADELGAELERFLAEQTHRNE